MSVAQTKAVRLRQRMRYGEGKKFGWKDALAESIEKERARAERERARQKKSK